MSEFIREVNEEVRQDQFRRFLERYWIVILAVVVLVLGAVGAWRANLYFTTRQAQVSGGQYLDALDLTRAGKAVEAKAALDAVVKDGTPGYKLLARFRLAAETGQTDATAGAQAFDAIAADGSVDASLRDLARLRAALLLLDQESYADIKKRLDPLADANNGYRNSARELLAIAALKAGQSDDAGRALDAIETDPTTTAALRQRAEAMLGLVRAGGADKTAETAPVVPATPAVAPPTATTPAVEAPATPDAPVAAPAASVSPITTPAPDAVVPATPPTDGTAK
ncbi:tetratricopeptide repeat protein [Lichenihabitans psoromatis]|uniref:tetratricopeptide repeat protein n=1 Tax=Lichenihabitans psoromatis TaxID=2528642 RepID=UPI0010385221|nr:tetratricopeptide repeat protein [Lichenihabitans psoromatis]